MAIIKRCVICDEKLVRNRCPLCGLDHSRRLKITYRLNTSRPYQSYTQQSTGTKTKPKAVPNRRTNQTVPNRRTNQTVPNRRTERSRSSSSVPRTEYLARTTTSTTQPQTRQKKKEENGKTWTRFLPAIIWILVLILVNVFSDESDETYVREPEYVEQETIIQENTVHQELYENVAYDLANEGEHFEIVLSQGEYFVGTHLPEGYYHIDLVKGSCFLNVINFTQGIYDGYQFDAGEGGIVQLDDLPLYQDTQLVVMEGAYLALSTDTGQTDIMYETVPNSLPMEEVSLEKGIPYIVGTDLAAGVYDLQQIDGAAYVITGRSNDIEKDSLDITYRNILLDINGDEKSYHNLVLEDGMIVYLDPTLEGTTILLPSEIIKIDGYDTYYELYG